MDGMYNLWKEKAAQGTSRTRTALDDTKCFPIIEKTKAGTENTEKPVTKGGQQSLTGDAERREGEHFSSSAKKKEKPLGGCCSEVACERFSLRRPFDGTERKKGRGLNNERGSQHKSPLSKLSKSFFMTSLKVWGYRRQTTKGKRKLLLSQNHTDHSRLKPRKASGTEEKAQKQVRQESETYLRF